MSMVSNIHSYLQIYLQASIRALFIWEIHNLKCDKEDLEEDSPEWKAIAIDVYGFLHPSLPFSFDRT